MGGKLGGPRALAACRGQEIRGGETVGALVDLGEEIGVVKPAADGAFAEAESASGGGGGLAGEEEVDGGELTGTDRVLRTGD